MFKKTLLASSLTVTLALGAQGVQANPVNNLLEGLFNNVTQQQLDARRGGGARRTSTVRRSSTSSSTSTYKSSTPTTSTTNQSTASSNQLTNKSTTPNTSTASNTSTANKTTGTNNTATNNTTNQQDAQFSQRAGYNQNQNQYGNTGYAPQQRGGLGMGSTFISSLAGAGAGVLLANMLLSPAQAAEAGTEVATPDMLSDDQIKECLSQLDNDLKDAEKRLDEASEDTKAQISEEITKMHELQIVLIKEQLNRQQNQ